MHAHKFIPVGGKSVIFSRVTKSSASIMYTVFTNGVLVRRMAVLVVICCDHHVIDPLVIR